MAAGTRERIIDAALRLFGERGVAATPVTAIEAAAGLASGSGSFYRHFKDKNELLLAVIEREMARVKKNLPQLADLPRGDDRSAAPLAAQLMSDLDFLADLRPMMAILMWERGHPSELSTKVRGAMVERGVELGVADLLVQSRTPAVKDDLEAAATVMMYAMVGYFLATDFFGAAAGGVSAERFTTTLARLMVDPADIGHSPPRDV
ncbi:TetR/AcrR family transcriptional regulator [Fodinicola feengrottensis]|uniref:HTH tetR-type domain-containing protein n=1 Tax=Fodinicola feengrottensis TaxID=435914 RepID=A0ABN2HNB3_9ACTN|nr:TetR/AcrR family transcriptional regulator [Fodinicola feengrottensis]